MLTEVCAARAPGTPEKKMLELAATSPAPVRRAAAANPVSFPSGLRHAEGGHRLMLCAVVAASADCPARVLGRLAASNDPVICGHVAENPACPPRILLLLASHRHKDVAAKAAANPGTPAAALARLADAQDSVIRAQAAANPSTPAAALARLADSVEWNVRMRVAYNPQCPRSVLESLRLDRECVVGNAAAEALSQR